MDVKGVLNVSRRANTGLKAITLTEAYAITKFAHAWLSLDPGGSDRDVSLPDATGLPNGWAVVIENTADGTEALIVKDDTTGTTLQTISAPAGDNDTKAYQFVLKDNSTADGVWYIIELGDPTIDIAKYYASFDEVDDWSVPAGDLSTFTISGATHGRGLYPLFSVHETSGAKVICHEENVDIADGDIVLTVTEGDEFDGFIIVM